MGTNALLQRRGARNSLVTTAGFEDVIEIGRQARPGTLQPQCDKASATVVNELRFGVDERVIASGEVIQPLRDIDLKNLLNNSQANWNQSPSSHAILFVYPEHERKNRRRPQVSQSPGVDLP